MKLRDIGIVYRKEMKDTLRDRRALISMIAGPILLMPLLTIGMGGLAAEIVGRAMGEVPKVMILGGTDSPSVMAELRAQTDIKVVPASSADYAQQIEDKRIRAAVEIPPNFDASLAAGTPSTVTVYEDKNDLKSSIAADRLQKFFRDLRDRTVRERLEAQRLPDSLIHPFDLRKISSQLATAVRLASFIQAALREIYAFNSSWSRSKQPFQPLLCASR